MTNNEQTISNLKKLKSFHNGSYGADIDRAIKVLEQYPEDAISRQAVLGILKDKWNMFSDANDAMQESIDTIEAFPPVTPQPNTGHWVNGDPICPCCGEDKFKDLDADIWADWQPKYCPNCGARMFKPQESEE